MRHVVFDARCLQDAGFARRGVGRVALNLLVTRPEEVRVVGLVDPRLPDVIPEARPHFGRLATNAYMAHRACAGGDKPVALVSASPMTHDGTFTARLAADPRVLHAAVVYDFIPRDWPEHYLPGTADRLAYATQLRWLAGADLFASISQASADDMVRLLGVDRARIVVTGAPMVHRFPPGEAAARRGTVLVVSGADPRKRPDTAVIAHARAARLQSGRVRLVIGGAFPASSLAGFRELAAVNGGDPDLVVVPGHVDDAVLAAMYQDARIVVCPSLAEGFSLPVLEGMAADAVVLASDIPAHAELVPDVAMRFRPGDAAGLVRMLETWWELPAGTEALLAGQRATAERFTMPAVGGKFWRPLLEALDRMPAAPALHQGRRPRVAMMTPLPPDPSGVADYTAQTCAELGKLAELHCFAPTLRPAPLPNVASMQPLSALAAVRPDFDAVVAVVGNSHFHTEIFHHALEYGAVIIAHDARMLGFYRLLLGEERALREAGRELGRPVPPEELDGWMANERELKALFLGELARTASPLVVHSPVTAELVRERYGVEPAYLPFSIYRPWRPEGLAPAARAEARRRVGAAPGSVLLATFGHVHSSKAPEECIWAVSILRGWGVPAELHFVGGVVDLGDGGVALMELAAQLGVAAHVRLRSGFVPERHYQDVLAAADVAIQLRTYGLGGLSGAVLDCAAAGLPCVVNQGLFDAVRPPPGYTRSVPDALSPLLLAEAVAGLLEDGVGRDRTEAERREFDGERSMAVYARGLYAALGCGAA